MADEREPEPADGIALLRAHLAGDAELVEALLSACDVRSLFALTVGQLVALLDRAGVDAPKLDAQLASWQEIRRASL